MRYLSLPHGVGEVDSYVGRPAAERRCSVAEATRVVGDRWAILVMREAFYGRSRFEEFERSLGVASNVLSGRLKSLVGAGLLERRASVEAKRPSYHLTEKGRAFFPVYLALKCWADDWSSSQEGVVTETGTPSSTGFASAAAIRAGREGVRAGARFVGTGDRGHAAK
ncbi:helix-turn-helix domain-containing protein [Cupriavidus sp. WKF15]|uniref:winged helix-turn-helix transcriptional regulator n=1 Tax=Cupriavidus sp. WKF15 TaxID=3032282 RepID=UPI0023E15DAF|nr:helix-turn-helix domain-containing protein [Cupriavidus sp. WKF15]WER50338.1 helix-turn-helix domain-containing protein [Cupriavidus sp. WKF15]